jgi:fumarate reductase flavoprotein subunit
MNKLMEDSIQFVGEVDILIAGAGGCGLAAALAASGTGMDVAVFEKTNSIIGNTALSAGLIPASGTTFQKGKGIQDSPSIMMEDILKKNKYESDDAIVRALCEESANLVEWLHHDLGIEMSVVTSFKYPGQRFERMHGTRTRTGAELIKRLRMAAKSRDNIYITMNSQVVDLISKDKEVIGAAIKTREGIQNIKAKKIILATNGFGGNKEYVSKFIPEISGALYFGYEANTGDAIKMGEKVNAQLESMGAFQGHSSVVPSHGSLMTWGTIMLGGFMVNKNSERFGNETQGYSEFAKEMLKQPEQEGYIFFNQDIHDKLLEIEEFQQLSQMRAFKTADNWDDLAKQLNLDDNGLQKTVVEFQKSKVMGIDKFGRTSFESDLDGKLYGVKVSPALFHTQGGLKINELAQVINKNGEVIPNLYAGGGAAAGISGNKDYGYMSGNGLLTALGLGKIAGEHAKLSIYKEKEGSVS